MTLENALNWRYATKRMTGEKVPDEKVDRILEAARLAPSSFGLQPYTLLVAEPLELRQRIAPVAMNQPQITECSHLVIFAAWSPVTEAQVDDMVELIARERDLPRDKLAGLENTVKGKVAGFASEDEGFQWAARQAYLGLGMALAAAAMERVDASPMEGFDPPGLDRLLGLREQGLRSVALMAWATATPTTTARPARKKYAGPGKPWSGVFNSGLPPAEPRLLKRFSSAWRPAP